jgi:hypothetical protein
VAGRASSFSVEFSGELGIVSVRTSCFAVTGIYPGSSDSMWLALSHWRLMLAWGMPAGRFRVGSPVAIMEKRFRET